MLQTGIAGNVGYGQNQAASNYAGQADYGAQSNAIAVPAPTLTRALSSLEELNKRLAQLTSGVQAIAQQIGGPFPTRTTDTAKDAAPQSAMESLNSKIDAAHSWAMDLANAQEAIRRSLGG